MPPLGTSSKSSLRNRHDVAGLAGECPRRRHGAEREWARWDSNPRLTDYESGNILARTYDIEAMPPEAEVVTDLTEMLRLYQDFILDSAPDAGNRPAGEIVAPVSHLGFRGFKPRDSSEYSSQVPERTQTKSRRHEAVLNEYADWATGHGFEPSNQEHPIDLVLRRSGQEILVEVKVVYQGNATRAVRDAVSQLFEYRYFLCEHGDRSLPDLLIALFSEPIGDAFPEYLEQIGIASVWSEGAEWRGSQTAVRAGLTSRLT